MKDFERIISEAIQDGGAMWSADLQPIQQRTGYLVEWPKYEARPDVSDVAGVVEMAQKFQEIINSDLDLWPDYSFIGLSVIGNGVYIRVYTWDPIRRLAIATAKEYDLGSIYDLEEGCRIWI